MKCENCGNEHDGSYGSGRFCSKYCAKAYSSKPKHKLNLDGLNAGEFPEIQSFKLKNWLIINHIKENKCDICGISTWLGKPIECHLHHKDGNKHNNKLSNLEILCPNCHSQTDNYTAKNIGSYD